MSRYRNDISCEPVGRGILFIIALFFLSCSGCGLGNSGGGFGGY